MRRVLKILAWTLAAVALTVVLLVSALFIAGNTDGGRRLIEHLTARLTHGHVQLAQLGGSFPSALDLGQLQLSDDQGIWLRAQRISLRWSPRALLSRHIEVESLTVGRLHIERRPVSKPRTEPSHFSIPRTDITHVSVDTLELGAPLAGRPASLVVQGNAHFRSLQDATASVLAQRSNGLGHYEVQLHFDPARIDAALTAREPADGPLENILGTPGLGDLSLVGKLSGPRTAVGTDLRLEAGKLQGSVQGTVDLNSRSADLQYGFDAPEMMPSPGISWQSIALHGHWQGPLERAVAEGSLRARKLQLPGGLGLASLDADMTARGGELSLHSVVEGLTIPGPEPEVLEHSPVTVDATMRANENGRPLRLSATHSLFRLQGQAVTSGEQSAELDLHLTDLSPLAAGVGQIVSGNASIKAQIERAASTTRLTADAVAAIDGGAASWAGVLRGDTKLKLSAALSDKALSVQRLSLTGSALSIELSGSAARSATRDLDAKFDLGLSDLGKLSPAFAGTARLSGKISGPPNNFAASVQWFSALSVHDSPTGTVTASVRATGLPKAPRGEVQAQGTVDGAPLLVDVSLTQEAGHTLRATVRHADWKSAHAKGDVSVGKDLRSASGMLQLQMSQLADLNRLLGTALQGGVSAELALRPGASVSSAHLQADARDVSAGGVTANAHLSASGTMDALDVRIDAQSASIAGAAADVSSEATLNMTARQLELSSLKAHYHDQALSLSAPASLSFKGGFSVTHLKLTAQEAVLELDGRLAPTLDFRASLKQLKPALINVFVPGLLAAGTLQADAQVKGTLTSPEGEVHAQAIGLRAASEAATGLPAADIHASAQLMGHTALVEAKLGTGKSSQLALSGRAPLARGEALDLKLAGNIDVGVLNPLTEPSGKHVEGELKIDTTVTGDTTAPDIQGTVRLSQGSLRDYTLGTNLSEITGEMTGSKGMLHIEKLTARATPGDVSVTGTIGILQKGIPVDLKLVARNAQPIASNIVTANINSELTVTGTAREHLDIAGKLNVNRADVQIPNGLPPNVAVLDVRRPGKGPPEPRPKRLVIGLNVSVEAPRQILVKGRGLDSELGGQIRVRGTTETPQVTGGFELLRGTFTLASAHLTFSQGSVTFNGEGLKNRIDPSLDFTAETSVADITATLRITGLADAPKIELSSTPDLPQDEILARLLFGVSASQLSALQVVQIGGALAALGGSGGGFNPLEKIQKTLGLDRLTVGGGSSTNTTPGTPENKQNNGASIEAGRYVSPRVFIGVKQSTTGNTQVAVDVDLARRLKLQAKVGNGTATAQGTTPENDPGSSIGLAYQWEY